MEKKESQEPKKRVSWGTTDIKYFYAVDEKPKENVGEHSPSFGNGDVLDSTLDYSEAANETASPYFLTAEEKNMQQELDRDFDKNLFEMNMASILEEGKETSEFRSIADIFENKEASERALAEMENYKNKSDVSLKEEVPSVCEEKPGVKKEMVSIEVEQLELGGRNGWADGQVAKHSLDAVLSEGMNEEEIISTVDVKKMIGEPREDIKVSEELAKHGVRFYYQMAISNKRRDTMSKLTSSPAPNLLLYYRNFLNEKIEYFNEFTGFLEQKMSEEDENIKMQEQFIDLRVFKEPGISSKLKNLKQVCRTKAKVKWYEIRKARELGLNSKISNNKNKMIEDFNGLNVRNTQVLESINQAKEKRQALERTLAGLRAKLGTDIGDQSPEHLRKIIEEKKLVIESCRKELGELEDNEKMVKTEFESLSGQKGRLWDEIRALESSIKNKCIGESELRKVKSDYESLVSVFDFEVLDLKQDLFKVRVGDYICSFSVKPGNIILVTNFLLEVRDVPNKFIYSLLLTSIDFRNKALFECIKRVMQTCIFVRSLVKDIRAVEGGYNVSVSEEEGIVKVHVNISETEKCDLGTITFRIQGPRNVTAETKDGVENSLPEYGFISYFTEKVYRSR